MAEPSQGGVEIERKWLVDEPPASALAQPADAIEQGYLAIGADGSEEVRLRRRGKQSFQTVKSGHGLARAEREVELTSEQFETLWPATRGRRVEKTRRVLEAPGGGGGGDGGDGDGGGVVVELDVYEGALSGLVVAEVEFPDEAAARRFQAPAWFGQEVTDDDAYKNRRLAVDGRP
jgi:adenylate cyclase